ncbi:hypothetical protein [Clostridium oryzae]|uniref:Uncharacterized protein n=1 Tax=Clostridium oryzae TaxID=1450648 RepID=A0A1V4IVC4_9CLOT|nr:hypothetical protein [Clostridium oryzae]OPJ63981.1 hypothetical protein CLORY_08530 [Clostridium oryzae]
MSKIISVFERFNIIEKANSEENSYSNTDDNTIEQVDKIDNIEDIENVEDIEEENGEVEQQYPNVNNDETKDEPKRKLTVEEIYSLYNLGNSPVNTIFMVGNFINALPESLPHEVRKKSLISIINSSNTDLKELLSDGKKRLEALHKYSDEYYKSITDTIQEYNKKIAELKKLIDSYDEKIKANESLLKEQNNTIDYETEKINNIINFFNSGD